MLKKLAVVAALGLGGVLFTAAPAQASYHSGTAGCFNWSWSDGIATTTVYYHNTCSTEKNLRIHWKNGSLDSYSCIAVSGESGKDRGSRKHRAVPVSFSEGC
ncbi:hypothetical protein AB0M43_27955 [Longispora sp. NPDC051575]|uniref:hypothetical protein n=1 Tax=Longispora sp. NPDC051575 TaxID=3154943 RepID=UPI0034152DF6